MKAEVYFAGSNFQFEVADPKDLIQSVLLHGGFYDGYFLYDMLSHIPAQPNILDVGANIGNHSVFFSRVCNARSVIPFELNPPAIELFEKNVALNDCNTVDRSFLGIGCSDSPGFVQYDIRHEDNLGATSFSESASGFRVDTLDNLINGRPVDFIKVDVEGMDYKVLRGGEQLIRTFRPMLYLEMFPGAEARLLPFLTFLYGLGYDVTRIHGVNILCAPVANIGIIEEHVSFDQAARNAFDAGRETLALYYLAAAGKLDLFLELHGRMKPSAVKSKLLADYLLETGVSPKDWDIAKLVNPMLLADPLYRNEIARNLFNAERRDDAYSLAAAGLSYDPRDQTCLHLIGVKHQLEGNLQKAIHYETKAYEHCVADRAAHAVRLASLLAASDKPRARALLDQVPPYSHLEPWAGTVRTTI